MCTAIHLGAAKMIWIILLVDLQVFKAYTCNANLQLSKQTHSHQSCHCFTKAFSSSSSSGEYRGNVTRRAVDGIQQNTKLVLICLL